MAAAKRIRRSGSRQSASYPVVRWLRAGAVAAGLGVAVTAAPGIAAADDTGATSGTNAADTGSSIAANPKATSASSPDPKTNRRTTQARKPGSNVESRAGKAVADYRRSVILPRSDRAPLAKNSTAATMAGASVTTEAIAPILQRSAVPYPTRAATALNVKEILKSVDWFRLKAFAPGMPPPVNPIADLASAIWVGPRRVHYSYENSYATLNPTPPTVNTETAVINGNLGSAGLDGDLLTYTVTNPSQGTLEVGKDGDYTYTPNAELAHTGGTDTFSASVTGLRLVRNVFGYAGVLRYVIPKMALSGTAAPDTTVVTVNIPRGLVNADPIVEAPTFGAMDSRTGSISGTISFTDADGDAAEFATRTAPTRGSVVVDATTGAFTYSPNAAGRHAAAANGATTADLTDTFTIAVDDGHGGTTLKTITVAISPANTVPTVVAASSVAEPTTGAIAGTLTATDADNDTVAFTAISSPSKGTLTFNPSGAFVYTPNAVARHAASAAGATAADLTDTFSVAADDGHGGTTLKTITVAISPANTAPTVVAAASVANPSTGLIAGTLTATDADNDTVAFTVITSPSRGAVTVLPTGVFFYAPSAVARHAASAVGATAADLTDTFTVAADDGHGGTTLRTITVTFSPANNSPTAQVTISGTAFANGDFANALTGWTAINSRVRLNGIDTVAGLPTPIDPTTAPDGGTEASGGSGTYSTTVTGGRAILLSNLGGVTNTTNGSGGVIHGPVVVSDNSVYIQNGATVQFDWEASGGSDAFDVLGYILNVDTGATHIMLNATGANAAATQPVTVVNFTVPTTGNYKFVFVSGTWDATRGQAAGARLSIDNIVVLNNPTNGMVAGNVTGSDFDGDTLNYSVTTGPTQGSVSINAGTGAFVYTAANPNANLSDSFSVTVTDGHGGSVVVPVSIP